MSESGTTESGYRLTVQDRIATLVLDRPPLNVLDIRTSRALVEALGGLAGRDDVGALVIAGAGTAFCAGVDVGEHRPETAREMLRAFHAFCLALLNFPRPTLARVDGAALGGGCEVLLCCDLAIAAATARIGQPEIALGVFPPLAAVLLPRLAGRRAASEAILWGEVLRAPEAARLGLVSEVVPADALDARVAARAARVAALSGAALRFTRRALRRGATGPIEEALAAVEEIYLGELMRTEDSAEGLEAFLAKRPPVWRHR